MKYLFILLLLCLSFCTMAQETPREKFTEQMKAFRAQINPLQAQAKDFYLKKDSVGMKKLEPELTRCLKLVDSLEHDYLNRYPDDDMSLTIVIQKGKLMVPEIVEPMYAKLSSRLQGTNEGKALKQKIEAVKATYVGRPAIPFSQQDMDGNMVSLSSYRGKYVLVDFWASWCVPCRAEHPYLKKAYTNYREKNFDIIGISVDNKEAAWKKAVADDQLPWKQLSDLKGIQNEVARLYGVTAVPQNFLVNPQGIIIARNLRHEELEKKLKELIR